MSLDLVQRLAGQANACCWNPPRAASAVSVPALPGHPDLALPAERIDDLIEVLQSAKVSRVPTSIT